MRDIKFQQSDIMRQQSSQERQPRVPLLYSEISSIKNNAKTKTSSSKSRKEHDDRQEPGNIKRLSPRNLNRKSSGPIVGILTSAIKNGAPPRGKTGKLFKEFIHYAGQKGVFIYLFSPKQVNTRRKYIQGITLDARQKWTKGTHPWPDIVYNRIRFRKIEKRKEIVQLLNMLDKDEDIYLFNTRFLNKREVYDALIQHPQGRNFVPETREFGRDSLRIMLEKYLDVFIKPEDGSIGHGIIKVKTLSPGKYTCAEASSSAPGWSSPYRYDALLQRLFTLGVQENNYLVQQAVDLARYGNRIFDLRTQVQKNHLGQWVPTGAAIRVAGKDRFVTHIPNGGRAAVLKDVIPKVFVSPQVQQSIYQQLDQIAAIVPEYLEDSLGLNLAILSMDIGIDTEGKMWLLEVNSKPSSFDENDIRRRHLQLLTDFLIYTAKERKKEGH